MNLTQPFGPRDQASALDGDAYFLGVDERRSPQQLEPGLGSYGLNARHRKGKAETRPGVPICPWMKDDGRTPWTEVYGGCVFADPNQAGDWLVIAADGGVWKTRPNMAASAVPLPPAVSLTAATFKMFVPVTDGGVGVLVLLRGPDADPLVCVNLDLGFTAVPAATPPATNMPRSRYGINWINRLLLVKDRDSIQASDLLAYNDFIPLQTEYRINPGDSQELLRIQPMPNQTLLCFKAHRVLAVTQVQNGVDSLGAPVLVGAGPDDVTDQYGIAGPLAGARNGQNAYWLTDEPAIASLELTALNQSQNTEYRLSDALSQTFGRINSRYLVGAVLEVWDGRLYCALPLDDAEQTGPELIPADAVYYALLGAAAYQLPLTPGNLYEYTLDATVTAAFVDTSAGVLNLVDEGASGQFTPIGSVLQLTAAAGEIGEPVLTSVRRVTVGVNNAVVVFDFAAPYRNPLTGLRGAWCGVDEAPGVFAVKAFLKTAYQGRTRLFILGADGTLRLYEEGYHDEVIGAAGAILPQDIRMRFRTRGYASADPDRKRHLAAAFLLRTWNPSYTVRSITPAYADERDQQAAVTRDRTAYDRHGTAPYVETNTNDDHGRAGRLDYSVIIPAGGFYLGGGVNFEAHQASTERLPLDDKAHWLQVEFENTQGRLEVLAGALESQPHEKLSGAHIL